MKGTALRFTGIYLGALYLLTVLLPFGMYLFSHRPPAQEAAGMPAPAFAETAALLSGTPRPAPDESAFRMHDAATGETSTVDNRSFLIGALACEMSPNVPQEALKAQTVAAYSYYAGIRAERVNEAYDLVWDSGGTLVYKPLPLWEQAWGDAAAENKKIYEEAVDAVYGQTLTYDGSLACAAFFPLSSGRTENALDIWGRDFPYLVSVASPYDTLSSEFERSRTMTPEEVRAAAEAYWPGSAIDFTLPPESWFSQLTYTVGGSVVSLNLCGFFVTGVEAAAALSLESSVFSVSYSDGSFLIKSKGKGHGVGMSQTGAVYMAAEGAGYREILSWYYPGTALAEAQ